MGLDKSSKSYRSIGCFELKYPVCCTKEEAEKVVQIVQKLNDYHDYQIKNGRAPCTAKTVYKRLIILAKKADLLNTEEVKAAIISSKLNNSTKFNTCNNYSGFIHFLEEEWKIPIKFKNPRIVVQEKVYYIPTADEVNILIGAAGRNMSAVIQCLIETGMRIGEATELRWEDIDFNRKLISVNHPEKGSLPRLLKVSDRLLAMIGALPRTKRPVFLANTKDKESLRKTFEAVRKRAFVKSQNSNILKIHFHTFRHYKATNEFLDKRDSTEVRRILGHKTAIMTDRYINIAMGLIQDAGKWSFKVAHNIEEEGQLICEGWELVRAIDKDTALYRKRK